MRFKSDKQRKAVMAQLKNSSFKQIQNKGLFLKHQGDADRDGVPNIRDCKPLNPKKQGFLHEFQMKRLKAKEEKLETQRRRQLKKLETVKEELEVKQRIAAKESSIANAKLRGKQAVIDEINKEQKKIKDLKDANKLAKEKLFDLTLAGKAAKATKTKAGDVARGSKIVLDASRKFFKKKSTKKALKKIGGLFED